MSHGSPVPSPLFHYRRTAVLLSGIASLLLMPWTAAAQSVQQRLDALSAHLKQIQDFTSKLPDDAKAKLSAGAQHQIRMAADFDKMLPPFARTSTIPNSQLGGKPFHPGGPLTLGMVSDPSTDLNFSRMAGFVQSETSTAWCGQSVVVAYNDSGSFLETFPIPTIGLSFNGYSNSTDGGRSFTDQGFLPPGPNLSNFLGGDPVVVCTDQNTFYYSSIFQTGFSTGVSVSKSADGGQTFADPVAVVLKDGFFHFIDKPWMAADPSNPNKLYATYTDFDIEGFFPGLFPHAVCPGTIRLGIELVASKDGGATWSTPTVVDKGCFPNEDQGSNVAVDGKGNVFVAWEQFPVFLPTNEIDIARSTDGGKTFAPKSTVAIVTVVGSIFGLLQGGFRNNEFPSLAIDLSQGPGKGPLYIAWNDGRNGVTPDGFPPGFTGITYNFGDAFVSRSNDGGATWSAAVKVNDDLGAANHIDHYLPGVAVSGDGSVGMCWYDRRRDPENFLIDRECASSTDGGRTWNNTLVTKRMFSPIIADDLLINPLYMGDYDGVAADSLKRFQGFLGAYGNNARGNPDVRISRRFGTSDDSGAQDDN